MTSWRLWSFPWPPGTTWLTTPTAGEPNPNLSGTRIKVWNLENTCAGRVPPGVGWKVNVILLRYSSADEKNIQTIPASSGHFSGGYSVQNKSYHVNVTVGPVGVAQTLGNCIWCWQRMKSKYPNVGFISGQIIRFHEPRFPWNSRGFPETLATS